MKRVFVALLLLWLACEALPACTIGLPQPTQVRDAFSVMVKVGGQPLPGATIDVRGAGTSRSLTSGSDGVAEIPRLDPGNYSMNVTIHGAYIGGVDFFVSRDDPRSGKKRLTFEPKPYEVKGVRGGTYDEVPGAGATEGIRRAQRVRIPVRGVQLRLTNMRTKEELEVQTDANGSFRFAGVAAGLYILALAGGESDTHWDGTNAAYLVRVSDNTHNSQVALVWGLIGGSCASNPFLDLQ